MMAIFVHDRLLLHTSLQISRHDFLFEMTLAKAHSVHSQLHSTSQYSQMNLTLLFDQILGRLQSVEASVLVSPCLCSCFARSSRSRGLMSAVALVLNQYHLFLSLFVSRLCQSPAIFALKLDSLLECQTPCVKELQQACPALVLLLS